MARQLSPFLLNFKRVKIVKSTRLHFPADMSGRKVYSTRRALCKVCFSGSMRFLPYIPLLPIVTLLLALGIAWLDSLEYRFLCTFLHANPSHFRTPFVVNPHAVAISSGVQGSWIRQQQFLIWKAFSVIWILSMSSFSPSQNKL